MEQPSAIPTEQTLLKNGNNEMQSSECFLYWIPAKSLKGVMGWVEIFMPYGKHISPVWLEIRIRWHLGKTSHIEFQKQIRCTYYEVCGEVSCYFLAWLILKMEAARSSETWVDFQRYEQRYITVNGNLLLWET
jgi:hypothetical protein